MNRKILSIDIDTSCGRAILGTYNEGLLITQEIYRFQNEPVSLNGTLYWDFLRLLFEIKNSIRKANTYGTIDSIGIDTWGYDFGLLDQQGNLLENPVHYLDKRTKGMIEESSKILDSHQFYKLIGKQSEEMNTIFQLLSIQRDRPSLLQQADSLLLIPDLINYYLTGVKKSEYSIASTTQLMNPFTKLWDYNLLSKFTLPNHIFQELIHTGTILSPLSEVLCKELKVPPSLVIAVAGHNTQCALTSTPSIEDDFIYLISSTNSFIGTELSDPLIQKKAELYNFTNESGYESKMSLYKNVGGFWLIQECRNQWILEGRDYDYTYLEEISKTVKPFHSFIDPDNSLFSISGNIPQKIKDFCKHSKQNTPFTEAEIIRILYESLALNYRMKVEEIQECTGKIYHTIYMLGNGIQSKLLCQMTADATNCTVIAGPKDGTICGNLLIQLLALEELKDLKEARKLIQNSCTLEKYIPHHNKEWNDAFMRFQNII